MITGCGSGGNSVHKYENMNFAIIENFDQIDASEKGTFHVTVWRTGDERALGVNIAQVFTFCRMFRLVDLGVAVG